MRSETASVHSGDLSFWPVIVQLGGRKGHLLIENLIDSSKRERVCGYDSESKITGCNHLCVIVLVNITVMDVSVCHFIYLFVCFLLR